ncbi:hypothetical protein, partial [Streptococcus respiraculi]
MGKDVLDGLWNTLSWKAEVENAIMGMVPSKYYVVGAFLRFLLILLVYLFCYRKLRRRGWRAVFFTIRENLFDSHMTKKKLQLLVGLPFLALFYPAYECYRLSTVWQRYEYFANQTVVQVEVMQVKEVTTRIGYSRSHYSSILMTLEASNGEQHLVNVSNSTKQKAREAETAQGAMVPVSLNSESSTMKLASQGYKKTSQRDIIVITTRTIRKTLRCNTIIHQKG